MHWRQDRAYFLPLQKGVGCGWVCKQTVNNNTGQDIKNGDEENTTESSQQNIVAESSFEQDSEAILYTLKVTQDALDDEDVENAPDWVVAIKESFRRLIEDNAKRETNESTDEGMEGTHLTPEESKRFLSIVEDTLNSKQSST
jgi:hypothetical protein